MSDPQIGEMVVHDFILPPLLAGRYRVDVSTAVTVSGADKPLDHKLGYFDIATPRFSLAATEVSGVFPPRNGHGPFDDALPHVALGRRTLPWERLFAASKPSVDGTATPIPWLALLVFEDGECTIETQKKISDQLPRAVVDRLGVPGDTLVDTVSAPRTLIRELMPTFEELALLTHVRQVNVDDRELAAGDSDGYFAVLMSNRIPSRGRKYRCCLVSIEERTDLVSDQPPPAHDIFEGAVAMLDNIAVEISTELAQPPGTRPFVPTVNPAISAVSAMPATLAQTTVQFAQPSTMNNAMKYSQAAHVGLVSDRLILLTTWTFECEGTASFRSLMQGLDVGMIGKTGAQGPRITDTGHLRVDMIDRAGAPETVFYRGPLAPMPITRDPNGPYHSADQARRVAPEVGAEDISYASAFEVGRLLAAADARLAQELMRWRRGAYHRAVRAASTQFLKEWLRITDAVDDHLPLATWYATRTIERMAKGCGPLADVYDLNKMRNVPGFDAAQLQRTFDLTSLAQVQTLLGIEHALLTTEIVTPPLEAGHLETFDDVLRDSAGRARLIETRTRLLDNVKAQLAEFGGIIR